MSKPPFSVSFSARWADVDANRHMRHSAYSDYAAHARVMFFQDIGFDLARFEAIGVGPILFREELVYRREISPGESAVVDVRIRALSQNVDRWSIQHAMLKAKDTLAATIIVEGAWMDIATRKLVAPPQDLAQALLDAARINDFSWIERPA